MLATNSITIDGQTFDRYSLNLAISGRYEADGSLNACINLMITPTRIAEGEVLTAPEAAVSILRGRLAEVTEPAEQAAIAAIQAALQTFFVAKEL